MGFESRRMRAGLQATYWYWHAGGATLTQHRRAARCESERQLESHLTQDFEHHLSNSRVCKEAPCMHNRHGVMRPAPNTFQSDSIDLRCTRLHTERTLKLDSRFHAQKFWMCFFGETAFETLFSALKTISCLKKVIQRTCMNVLHAPLSAQSMKRWPSKTAGMSLLVTLKLILVCRTIIRGLLMGARRDFASRGPTVTTVIVYQYH